ncbi:MAG: hypothetical protein O3A93_04615 [Chloroflexi bacterium]|nr:hypothetical protein [Chloroflexota bacterium]MDA1270526.1 hypothetical protein [Chloroflexota bacterium]PKB59660.1 MAG: hypothetical protein BZY83_00550 [SAR202 cluster bacterium Casp-Chloro-G2]
MDPATLTARTPKDAGAEAEPYAELTNISMETAKAVDNQGLGWGLFAWQKYLSHSGVCWVDAAAFIIPNEERNYVPDGQPTSGPAVR